MKIGLIAVVVLLSLASIYLFVLGQNSRSGNAPGLLQGRLGPCPDKPNCVSSEQPQDNAHYVEPLDLTDMDVAASMQSLREIIIAQGGIVKTASSTYIAATFSSSLFGFVDDVEIRADATAGVIHLRSASRVGTSDLGANRKRVNLIKQRFRGN
jgi:uncharacterized protein (DUF1499 family)